MPVTSTKSARVTAVRALHERKGRRAAGRFVVEGPQAVAAALAAGAPLREVYATDEALMTDLVRALDAAGVEVVETSPQALAAMAQTQQPQGVVAVCDLLPNTPLDELLAGTGPVLVLEALADPGNVGTAIRAADAAGAAGVVLTVDSADPHNGKVVRSTAGSLFHLPICTGVTIDEVADAAVRAGRTLAVATGDGDTDLVQAARTAQVDATTVWVVGSEAHGVSPAARARATRAVRIPMTGRAESLNAGVAAAVVLYVTLAAAR